jgi:hypothetical protein
MSSSTVQSNAELVSWSLAIDRGEVQAGDGPFVARVKARIAGGYHLYSVTQMPGGPTPTSITAASDQPFAVERVHPWPQPVRVFDPKFGMETEHHAGEVLFDVMMKAGPDAPVGPHDVVLTLEYQLCDDRTCLRPERQELPFKIEVKPGEKKASDAGKGAGKAAAPAPRSSEERFRELIEKHPALPELTAGVRRILDDDPKFTSGYLFLAKEPAARADFRAMRAILRQGIVAGADRSALEFAMLGCGADPARRRRKVQQYVRRFPKAQQAQLGLRELAATSRTPVERLRQLRKALSAARHGSVWVLWELCPLLAGSNPEKAARLAKDARRNAEGFFEKDAVEALAEFYGSIAKIHGLLRAGRTSRALSAAQRLEAPEVPHFGVSEADKVVLRVVRTQALAAVGRSRQAYEELLADPLFLQHEQLINLAFKLGKELGKSRTAVEGEAWQGLLEEKHSPAEFELPNGKRSLSPQDFSGKVLLVNVWNPG